MGTLKGLEGVSVDELECVFIQKPSDIRKILASGKAATTAGPNGAINVWKDDSGKIRCDAMRWLVSVDKKEYISMLFAEKWVSKWMREIQ